MTDHKPSGFIDQRNAENIRQWRLKTIQPQTRVLQEFASPISESDEFWYDIPACFRACSFFVRQAGEQS